MQKRKSARARLLSALALAGVAAGGWAGWSTAADHRDSAALTEDRAGDIADVYVFRSPSDASRLVLAMTVHGLIPPAEAAGAAFDPNVLYQFKLDTTGDAVEDLVIQAFATGAGADQVVHFRGPVRPTATGSTGRLMDGATISVRLSRGATAETRTADGMTVFAGLRDDPFFFDLGQFRKILGGQASGFNTPGTDAFAGTNVLALVVELPIARLAGATSLGVWGTTSRPN